jgi:tripartite-type tricarboxylate transporter receptor subunit TctC
MRWSTLVPRGLFTAFGLLALASQSIAAPGVEAFYRGKQISFYIRAAPGGNYDLYSRLLAQYMTR